MFGVSVSANRIGQLLMVVTAALAWLVAIIAMTEATHVSMVVIVPLTLVFGLLVGAVSWAVASGLPTKKRACCFAIRTRASCSVSGPR